ncbi:hypothetical protein VNO77_22653 [Canavalia gladiata]|uniref:Uncharacterized protein n=1 Tax=Canavalia gladiata TaxID=3824 RepID=A0AAN9L688_CANGL
MGFREEISIVLESSRGISLFLRPFPRNEILLIRSPSSAQVATLPCEAVSDAAHTIAHIQQIELHNSNVDMEIPSRQACHWSCITKSCPNKPMKDQQPVFKANVMNFIAIHINGCESVLAYGRTTIPSGAYS